MGLSALVVDDDEFVRGTLSQQLSQLGVSHIATAGDGAAAACLLDAKRPFDVILLDLMMPGVDGVQFLRQMGEAHVPSSLIITSSVDQKLLQTVESLALAHGLHVLGTARKPITPSSLRQLLNRLGTATPIHPSMQGLNTAQVAAALANGRVRPHFQPKVDAHSGQVLSVEALARWIEPDGSVIMPGQFIAVAEAHGLIDELTQVIARGAFATLAQWQAEGLSPGLEINLSARSLGALAFPDEMFALTQEFGLDPAHITFELTESALVDDPARSLDTLTRLRLKGFHLAVDDFGTGYATFSQLKALPLSELKIDSSFVGRAHADAEARVIVESCVELAQNFKLISVAEGVEDEDTAAFLRGLNVDLLQGYLYSRPLPAEQLYRWWRARSA